MTDDVLIKVCEVTKTYPLAAGLLGGGRVLRALRGVSLEVRRGECLAIVGESGSGKTTLASLMLGLEAPSSGEVRFRGEPVQRLPRRVLARQVQPVFQDPYASLNPRQTIRTIVGTPLRVHDAQLSRRERDDAVAQMIDQVGLAPAALDAYPSQLSGGQRQRVAIARALVIKPAIVICDEPTSALDVSVQAQILNLLQDLRAELGLTLVFISHDLSVVSHVADRVAVMHQGEIVEEGPVGSIFDAPQHPYTRRLLGSVLDVEPAASTRAPPEETARG